MLSVEIQFLIDTIARDGLEATLDSDVDWTPIEDVDPVLYEAFQNARQAVGILKNTLENISSDV